MTTTSGVSSDIISNLQRDKQTTTDTSKTSETQSRFLTLLTAQLKSQDPMNPMDNAETTSQLAQISTVDGIEKLNKSIEKLLSSQANVEATQAANLVGHYVLVPGNGLQLASTTDTDGTKTQTSYGGVTLAGDADKVTLSVYDANGTEVAVEELGALKAGSHEISWDGGTKNGTAAADGRYTIKIKASLEGEKVDATTLELGKVGSVVKEASGVSVDVGRLGRVTLDNIVSIM